MKHQFLFYWFIFSLCHFGFAPTASAQLKSIIYDFEGLDLGQTDLPEGDYHNYDMQSSVSVNPLGPSSMLGDRVLKLNMPWSQGKARFGKGISRFIELDASLDYFNFYIYNPLTNASSSKFDITITEDDNKNNVWEDASDDRWKRSVMVDRSSSWQLICLPLSSFTDNNTGGNGIFDAAFTNQSGKVFNIEFNFYKNLPGETGSLVYMDMICFSEGVLPTGSTILDYPAGASSDHCVLGAFTSNSSPQTTPASIEGLFPANPQKKLKYVNWFVPFSDDGTTIASKLPGSEVTQLLQGGYTPLITWEAMYSHLSRLDPAQPRLNNLMSGQFDAYIDAFGDRLKSYNDTIIIRFMHEFEGDWYPWSLAYNNQDPNLYISVFRKVVDRIRARGATKVKWMWCINGPTYHPVLAYNWIKSAYPGDAYVDIVACEAYNMSISGIPYWRSFRTTMAEPYYYLRKYFASKPMYICENGCRERYSSEMTSSETKPQWIAQMNKELRSHFHEIKALLFFNANKSQDYRINSTEASRQAVETNIWNDPYYFNNSGNGGSSTGSITVEMWTNIPGNSVSSIPVNTPPNSTGILNLLEAPKDVGDNFGRRIRGYIYPPVTGNYVFWIASNNASELWLSTNDQVQNKVKIASVTDWTNYREWTKYPSQQSVSKYLVAGQKYYIEALHKEGTQGDHVSVGWQLPNGTLQRPVPGSVLSPYTQTLAETKQYFIPEIMVSGPIVLGALEKTTLRTLPDSTFAYQWMLDGVPLDGENKNDLIVTKPGAYSVRVISNGNVLISQPVVIEGPVKKDMPSDSTKIFTTSEDGYILKIFPNPNDGAFTIALDRISGQDAKVKMMVVNSLGQIVFNKEFISGKKNLVETIELGRSLPPGIYTLQITIGNKTESANLVLSR